MRLPDHLQFRLLVSSEMIKRSFKKFQILVVVPFLVLLAWIAISSLEIDTFNGNAGELSQKAQLECRDWHDYKFIVSELRRKGPGEQGQPVKLTDPTEIKLNQKFYNQTGVSVLVSDNLSVNRSIQDYRPAACHDLKYHAKLPKVSIIVIFHNEVKSVLLRTIHGIINRTPAELIHEVIMVNDASTDKELYEPLQGYVRDFFPSNVKIKNLKERKGLIVTRLEGARIATGEVLVFFDSHVEVGTNWLPPLLDPITRNRRISTVPVIDDFDAKTFENFNAADYGMRGGIDWFLIFRRFERYLPEGVDIVKPFPIPIQLGCAFAIDRKFFLEELGGYDEEFQVWNAENYELSFKLWLCADGLFEVPCSRVSHTFRAINPSRVRKDDFVARNFKRLVEVWMDEYKDVVYSWDPNRYKNIDPGNLDKPKSVRDRLNCKPFSYFMELIAPDIVMRYPITKAQPVFASGQIRSLDEPKICIDTYSRDDFTPIGLYPCHRLDESGLPPETQFFRLNFHKNIVKGHMDNCLDSWTMSMIQCSHVSYGNQYWRFDLEEKMLINNNDNGENCLTANILNRTLSATPCDKEAANQKWSFTYENETALSDWTNIYGYKQFVYGGRDINYDRMLPLDYQSC
jgi:polypeptide N-acetylgalactosaminyltransferase